jgi:protein TonB
MIKKSSTLISGLLAFGIYISVIAILIFYFNSYDQKKPVHYVKKNEERIRVSVSTPKPAPKKEIKKQPIKVVKPKPKPKSKPKKTVKKKVVKKKVIKEKVVKKAKVVKNKKDLNTTKPKKVNKPKDLFANITSKKKVEKPKPVKKTEIPVKPKKSNIIKVSEKVSAMELVSNSLKVQKKSDSGIENAYLAMIEEKLKGWPAQSEYAGEKAKVWIKVVPSGTFRFKVITASGHDTFNSGLIDYLKQLQKIGFGPHKGNRPYELDVEFIAKE